LRLRIYGFFLCPQTLLPRYDKAGRFSQHAARSPWYTQTVYPPAGVTFCIKMWTRERTHGISFQAILSITFISRHALARGSAANRGLPPFEVALAIQARSASEWICKRLQAKERTQVESHFRSTRLRFVLVFAENTVFMQLQNFRPRLLGQSVVCHPL